MSRMRRLSRAIEIPSTVRIKSGALDRLGIYLQRVAVQRVALLYSDGLPASILDRALTSLQDTGCEIVSRQSVPDCAFETAARLATELSADVQCIVGLGGGKSLDVAKVVAEKRDLSLFVVPTSLSNDGFASPQASLTRAGRRQSYPARMPDGVVVDTAVCLEAPKILWLSGIGDLVSKLTAVRDWKMAFHAVGEYVDDFAALLSDASVFQFMGRPERDLEGIRLLATALMLNGVAMAVCGSSRPASGSEHLISHALDATSARPRLHGLQVGVATYLISQQRQIGGDTLTVLFESTGFWDVIAADPFSRSEWRTAIAAAPTMKPDFYTCLSEGDQTESLMRIVDSDPILQTCFVA